jgi:hypothetical protein
MNNTNTNAQAVENAQATPTLREVTLTKEYGIGKANTDLRTEVAEVIREALAAKYGNAIWVRTGSASGEVNEVACVCQTIIKDGTPFDHCITVAPTVKAIEPRIVKGKVTDPFDILSAHENYENWVKEKEEKAKKDAEKKAKKIAADKAKRERAKEKAKETEQSE